jgi:signal transduction histidine kinase
VERGRGAALQAHITKMGLGAEVHADSVASSRFDPQLEAAVYFCCREALQNASKHAPGAPVTVTLEMREQHLVFTVTDSGPGFDPEVMTDGSGLQNIADRVEAVGGHLEVRSAPGQGTTICGRVPARPATANGNRGMSDILPASSSA